MMPRFSCSIPTITWFRHTEYRIPENFKANRKWDVTFIKSPKCPPKVEILRLIKTAPFNFDLRQNMRSHIRNQKGQSQGVFFLIGKSDPNDQRTKLLEDEIEKFNDFIIGDYIDAYKNVTKKTFSGYKYVTENCNHDHKWVLYLDDDTLLDETQFQEMITNTEKTNEISLNQPYCFAGLKMPKSGVIRPDNCFISDYKINKYSVTKSAYHLDIFPAYCGGPCTLLPSGYLQTGYDVAKNTNPEEFHHDDVLFTGIIRVKAGAPDPINVNGICTHYNSENKLKNIRSVVFKYCHENNISEDMCLV